MKVFAVVELPYYERLAEFNVTRL